MADDPSSRPPTPPLPPVPATEEWSGISPGDLGMKAVYWKDEAKTGFTFRPIIGWITFGSRKLTDAVPTHGFAAIVIADWWLPALATGIKGHACIAPKDATDEEIIGFINRNLAANVGPNLPSTGVN